MDTAERTQVQVTPHRAVAHLGDGGAFVDAAATLVGLRIEADEGHQAFGRAATGSAGLPAIEQDQNR